MLDKISEIIQSCDIFSTLTPREIKSLASLCSILELQPEEALFQRGDVSRDAYILISGKLAATTATKSHHGELIGYIMPNEMVGEMSLLTEVTRSLTVTAQIKSSLVIIHQQDFLKYCHNHPEVSFKMLEVIIKRTQNIIKHYEKPERTQFVALIAANPHVDLPAIVHTLQEHTANKPRITVLNSQDVKVATNSMQHLLLTLRESSDYILYPISSAKNDEMTEIMVRYADKIVVFGQGSQHAQMDADCLALLKDRRHHHHRKDELVLLYDNEQQRPTNTHAWLQQSAFFRHHHIYLNKIADIQRLVRFLTGNAIGIVLGGGGVKGWAHLGALKAIDEANIPIDTIGGTSAGAAVGAAYLLTNNFQDLSEKYGKLTEFTLKSLTTREMTWPLISLFSGRSVTDIAQQEFSHHQLEDLPKPFFCISCNITKQEETIHKHGELWRIIRTTASLPGIVPPMVLNNELHVDGGVVNNLPVNVMSNFLENSGTIIAVSISSLLTQSVSRLDYTFPPVISLWDGILTKLKLKKAYKYPSLFNTFVDSLLMGSFSQQRENMKKADLLIQPDLSAYSLVSRNNPAHRLMQIGYWTAKNILEKRQEFVTKITIP